VISVAVLSVFLFGGNLRWRSLSPGDLKPPLRNAKGKAPSTRSVCLAEEGIFSV
jgi:hypothetical protein